jgi:hypothetical protein
MLLLVMLRLLSGLLTGDPLTKKIGGVVQLVRTLACHARGRRFKSGHSR